MPLFDVQIWKLAAKLIDKVREREHLRVDVIEGEAVVTKPVRQLYPQPGGRPPRFGSAPTHEALFAALTAHFDEDDLVDVGMWDRLERQTPRLLDAFLPPLVRSADAESLLDLCVTMPRLLLEPTFELYLSVGLGASVDPLSARLPGYIAPLYEFARSFADAVEDGIPRTPLLRIFSGATVGHINNLSVPECIRHAAYRFLLLHEFIKTFTPGLMIGELRYEFFAATPAHLTKARELREWLVATEPVRYRAAKPTLEKWQQRHDSDAGIVYACMHPIMFTDWHDDERPHAVVSFGGKAERIFRLIRRDCIDHVRETDTGRVLPGNAMLTMQAFGNPPYNFCANDIRLDAIDSHTATGDLRTDMEIVTNLAGSPERYKEFITAFVRAYPEDLPFTPAALWRAIVAAGVGGHLTRESKALLASACA